MKNKQTTFDVIIVGGGAAGFTAGMYAARRGLDTLIISKDIGGQAALTCEIENYPGVGMVEGPALMKKFLEEAMSFGAAFVVGEVVGIQKDDNLFTIKTSKDSYIARSIILAFGLTPRDLEIPGAKEFLYKGVSYCASYDAKKFANKDVAIIGGGNSALSAAEVLAPHANTIHIVHRRSELRAEKILADRIADLKKVVYHLGFIPTEITGNDAVEKLSIVQVDDEFATEELSVQGIIVAIGYKTDTKWLGSLVQYDTTGHIVVDKNNHTSTSGLFAAGDVTDISYKQIVISAGDGAKAALSAHEYLKKEFDIKGTSIDWGIVEKK